MNHKHNMVSDLLPLYVDGVCSSESASEIEMHLAECNECRAMLDELKSNAVADLPRLDSVYVIKKTGKEITTEAIFNVIGISIIVLYWILYAVMTPFANVGDYRYFPYSVWEVWGIGFILMPLFNLIWLIVVLRNAAMKKEWKKRRAILLVLAILLIGQIGIEYVGAHQVSTVSVGWIDEVGEGSFIFNNGGWETNISCSYEISGLLKADGTMYVVSYYHNKLFPNKASLSTVHEAGHNRSETAWNDSGSS